MENTVQGLKNQSPSILGACFLDVWSDTPKLIKNPESFKNFKKRIKGEKIKDIRRRGKWIVFKLSSEQNLLVHQKMTGHLLYGRWERAEEKWEPLSREKAMSDKMNSYIHLLFTLDNGHMLAFSDLRKFGRVELKDEKGTKEILGKLGPEALSSDLSFLKFKKLFKGRRGRVKSLLMNQKFIAGVGNIYSDEILWRAKVHPLRKADTLTEKNLERIFKEMKKVLKEAVKRGGTSTSDYRKPSGEKGEYAKKLIVYGKDGEKCPRCGEEIKRKKIGSRSTRFCPECQD